MSQAARYLFDLDFAAPPEPVIEDEIEEIPPEPMITVAEHEQLLAQAIERAHAEGEAKARDDRETMASEESLKLQKAMVGEIEMIYTEVGLLLQRLERDASNLAFAFASRFAEKLVAQEPKAEIMALLNQILAPLRRTPHISIRLNDEVADEIREAVDAQMSELGFAGTLTILPDPVIMPGDCEVEWADGGIGRNLRSAIRQVEQLLEDHFSHLPPPEDDGEDESPKEGAPEDQAPEGDAPTEDITDEDINDEEATDTIEPDDQTEQAAGSDDTEMTEIEKKTPALEDTLPVEASIDETPSEQSIEASQDTENALTDDQISDQETAPKPDAEMTNKPSVDDAFAHTQTATEPTDFTDHQNAAGDTQ